MMEKILVIPLALVILLGSIPLGFSEPLRVQLEQGIETNQIKCDNDSHVLVERDNGNLACVSLENAERTGWKIIDANNFQQQKQDLLEDIIEIKMIMDKYENEKSILSDHLNAIALELSDEIWNLKYDKIEEVQQKIISEKKKIEQVQVQIFQLDIQIYNQQHPNEKYNLVINQEITDPEQVPYHLSEEQAVEKAFSFIKTKEKYFISESDGGVCDLMLAESSQHIKKFIKNGVPYYKINVGSCNHSDKILFHVAIGIWINMDGFNGEHIFPSGFGVSRINNESEPTLEEQIEKLENSDRFWFDYQPELYHLNIQLDVRNYIENNNWPKYSEEQVITQATEYINSIDYLFTETEEDGKLCGLVLNENFNVGKMIIDDKPYHNISMGSCVDHDDMGLVGARVAEVIINAENSTDIDYIVYDFGDG